MSKSQPDSAIFMEDDEASVNKKIRQAFCPPQARPGPAGPALAPVISWTLPSQYHLGHAQLMDSPGSLSMCS